jgi:nicotinate (nicotinamide) nucleotide adenylyltransferase
MALEFIHRGAAEPSRVALFPGAWNPPTVAHLELTRAVLNRVDEVVWVLPRAFPHKSFDGASFLDRCRMMEQIAGEQPGIAVAVSDGGLYLEIAAEARNAYPLSTEIMLLCGRDAAERIADWDYGRPGVFDELLEKHRLLVAARAGEYVPPARHLSRIERIPLVPGTEDVSSSEVRRRVREGEAWEHLVPSSIVTCVREFYGIN